MTALLMLSCRRVPQHAKTPWFWLLVAAKAGTSTLRYPRRSFRCESSGGQSSHSCFRQKWAQHSSFDLQQCRGTYVLGTGTDMFNCLPPNFSMGRPTATPFTLFVGWTDLILRFPKLNRKAMEFNMFFHQSGAPPQQSPMIALKLATLNGSLVGSIGSTWRIIPFGK